MNTQTVITELPNGDWHWRVEMPTSDSTLVLNWGSRNTQFSAQWKANREMNRIKREN